MSGRRPRLPPGPYLVVGLARSGAAAARVLAERGETVIGVDAGEPDVTGLDGVELHLGDDGAAYVARARTLIKSPGVPAEAPAIVAARATGVEVIGELELAWRLLTNRFVAVTGTNGKTTTVELLGRIYTEAGLPVAVAGNVGVALSALVGVVDPRATIVCEASSFQLEDSAGFAPEVAVLLNLQDDHLDRHGTRAAYVAAKLRIFASQGNDDVAVLPDDLGIEDIGGCARQVLFGSGPEAELADRGGVLWWDRDALMRVEELGMRGDHNRLNAMAAAAAALADGVDADAVSAALRGFPGVAHRLEEVARRCGVLFVNDSKATNVTSTLVALRSFEPGSVRLILGGQGKSQDFTALRDDVERYCLRCYLIGEDAATIGDALEGLPVTPCGDLEHAVGAASSDARDGEVVLLSPACASFDQFSDFEARGECFRDLVARLQA